MLESPLPFSARGGIDPVEHIVSNDILSVLQNLPPENRIEPLNSTQVPVPSNRKELLPIRYVPGMVPNSGLKCGLALAQIGPALIGMVGHDGLPEDLLEIIDGELQIALGDGHMGMPQSLFHEVNIARPKILLQSKGVSEAVQ